MSANQVPPPEVVERKEQAERRYEQDAQFHARVVLIRSALTHTGISPRQIAWILHLSDEIPQVKP